MFLVEKLRVYKKAVVFSKEIIQVGRNRPAPQFRALYDQILRASSSIPLNIAEGNGRWGMNERKQFFRIARGSCHECVPLLDLLEAAQMINKAKREYLLQLLTAISKMINALIFGADKKRKNENQIKTTKPRAYRASRPHGIPEDFK